MKKNRFQKLKLIWSFLLGSKKHFIFTVISAMGIVLVDMITPQIVKISVDSVFGDEPFDLPMLLSSYIESLGGSAFFRERIWIIAAAVMAVAVFSVLFRYTFRVANTVAAETLVQTMRNKIFRHIERLPFSWHTKNQTGDIIQRCTSDVDMIKNFLSEQLTSMFRIIILLALSLFFMFSMNVKLTLIALVTMPIILIYSSMFHRGISKEFTKCDENEGKLSAVVQENLTGVRVVRAFGREG